MKELDEGFEELIEEAERAIREAEGVLRRAKRVRSRRFVEKAVKELGLTPEEAEAWFDNEEMEWQRFWKKRGFQVCLWPSLQKGARIFWLVGSG